jgi:glycosyltransferase involved in cell wall biosynthesis
MKLLLIGRWRPDEPSGPDNVLINLAREFTAAGHTVEVCWPRRSCTQPVTREVEPGIHSTEVPSHGPLPWLKNATRTWLAEAGTRNDAALIFSVFTPFNIAAARVLRCPYTAIPLGGYARDAVRNISPWKKRVFLALWERAFLDRATFVNVWSQNEADDISLIARPRRYVITPPGYRGTSIAPRTPRTERAGRRILFLGRFAIAAKGLDRLIAGFGRIAGPHDALTLAGADFRGDLAKLKSIVAASPARECITIQGPAWGEEKAALFDQHDIFTHLSRWEGLPLAVVEALAAGMPALVSKATNTGEYIRRHEAGWVVEGDDFDAAIRAALTASPDDLNTRGESARRLVATEFSWPAAAAKLAQAFQ